MKRVYHKQSKICYTKILKARNLLFGTLLATAGVVTSHVCQIKNIENKCDEIRKKSSETLKEPEELVREGELYVNQCIDGYKEDYDFILGDFEVEEGKARCGGTARTFAEYMSSKGFDTDIEVEINFPHVHYFAIASKDGETYRFDGTPPNAYAERIK